jgi:hypothetical protein
MKKIFWTVLAIAIASFISMGCATTALWQKSYDTKTYNDSIESFLMTEDGKKIIFISHDYHYILNSNPALSFLLTHKNEVHVDYQLQKGEYTSFDNRIFANFHAHLDLNQTNKQIQEEAFSHHYGTLNKESNQLNYYFNLEGTRYKSNTVINEKLTKFDQPILLSIKEQNEINSIVNTVTNIALTPLALAADGTATVVFLGVAVGAVIVGTPVIIIEKTFDHQKKKY